MLKWFLTNPDKPRIEDPNTVKKMYHTARVQAVTAMIIGYGMYYVMRMTLGVAKKPMIEAGFTPTELGAMGAAMMVAIAIGKCANGFIADHCNIKKIVPIGLLGAAIVNVILGFSDAYWVFLVLWGVNGVFQSMGAAPCIVSLAQWFSKSKLATYYGVFSIAHYLGEGATYLGTAMIIVAFGWHAAFFLPGVACIVPRPMGSPPPTSLRARSRRRRRSRRFPRRKPSSWLSATLTCGCLPLRQSVSASRVTPSAAGALSSYRRQRGWISLRRAASCLSPQSSAVSARSSRA